MRGTNAGIQPGIWAIVADVGLTLPGVETASKYDGSPVLKVGGCFMAGLAAHPSAEPDSMVVRVDVNERRHLLEAPDTYYLTDHYQPHPVVLVRLLRIDRDALRDLLTAARRLTLAKTRRTEGAGGSREGDGGQRRRPTGPGRPGGRR